MAQKRRSNAKTAAVLATVVVGMVGLAFASVPLYRMFCQVTGYGGTPALAKTDRVPLVASDRFVTVRFDSNVHPGLAWQFRPVQTSIRVHPGEQQLAFFEATNFSVEPILGRATFNVVPHKAGPFFVKIDCFCFNEQQLAPGQTVSMPVTFYVDPEMYNDVNTEDVETITLSYTFFRARDDRKAPPAEAAGTIGNRSANTNGGARQRPNG